MQITSVAGKLSRQINQAASGTNTRQYECAER